MRVVILKIVDRPIALARPRINMFAINRHGKGGHGPLVYTPKRSTNWQKLVKDAARELVKEPFVYPVTLVVTFWLKSFKKLSKYSLRPDIDNYLKNVMDGLDGAAFEDDAFVTEIHARKIYVDDAMHEGCEIAIMQGKF